MNYLLSGCVECGAVLKITNIVSEKRRGLGSSLYVICDSNLWWLVGAISLFRSFVFSPGVMARRQDEITPSEKTK